MDLDTDSVADDFLLPPAPAVRALGKFRPKAHPKTVKSVQAPSKPPVANELVPPVMEPLGHVSVPKSPDKRLSVPIASFSEERMTQEGISVERAQASDSDASLSVHSDKTVAEAMASSQGMESVDDGIFQSCATSGAMDLDTDYVADDILLPPAPAVRALGIFRPKAPPKTVKSVQALSKPPVANQLVPPVTELPGHVSDPKCPNKKSSLSIASFSEERMTLEGISVERAQASDSDASLCVYPDKTEAEAMTSSQCMESVDDGIFESRSTSGVMDLDADSVHDDFFLPLAPTVRALGKFRPKAHPKAIEPVQESLKSLVVTQLVPLIMEPPVCDSSLESQDEKLSLQVAFIDCSLTNASDLDTTHGSVCEPEAFPSEPFIPGGNNEDTSQRDQEEGEGAMDLDTDSLAEGLLLPPTPAVRALGKFRPKAHPKTAKPIRAPPKLHVTRQLVPSIQDPPIRVSDPRSPDESNLPIASIDDSLINASDLDATLGSVCQQEDFSLETSVTGGNNEVTLQLDQGEREVADKLSMECVGLNQPLPTFGRAVGRFKPKAELESKDGKLNTIYVADPGVIMSDSTQSHSIRSFAVEALPPEHQFCQEPFCRNEERMIQEGISPERAQLSGSDAHPHIHPEELEVDVVSSSTCLESVDDGLFQSHATSGAMELDVDSVAEDILLQPSPASGNSVSLGKFRPKAHPKSNKSVQAPSKPSVATQASPITEPPASVPDPKSPDERSRLPNASINDCLVVASGLDSTRGSVCQPEAFPSEPFVSGVNNAETLQCDQGGMEEAINLDVDAVAEDFLLQSAPAVKEAGRFRPKLVPRSKEKKVKRVSFNISDAAETVHPLDNHVSFSQNEGTEKVAFSTTELLCGGSLDRTPDSAFVVSDCSGDIGVGRMDLREEDTTEIAGLESLEKIPSQSTPKIGKFQPKLSSIVKNVKTNAPVTTHDVLASIHSERDSPTLESESLEGNASIVPPDSQFDSVITGDLTPADLILKQANHLDTCASSEYNHVVGRETSPELSKDISKEDHSHDTDVIDQIFNEKSASKVVVEGASKPSRKLRKRVNRTPVDEVREDRDFDNSNIHETEDARNGDEYNGKDAPKPKRGRKKMTKPITENEKPTRKRKKASEEPKSAEQEPKKKFPHSTRRNRRQVNKELLLMPDDEIDRRRISIKDLIRTYEAKERISGKDSAAWANSSASQSHKSFPGDTYHDTDNGFTQSWGSDDDAENENFQFNDTTVKWNHHSFRKNPTSTSRWSKSETELFYQALRQFGTNFEMIQKLFPGRTRHQMTLKFKNERRKFPLQIADATSHPSTDFSLVKLVMQKLAEEEKDKAKEKVFYVQEEGENEDENGQADKEEQEGNDCDSSVKPDDYEGAAHSPNQFNEYEDNIEWDGQYGEKNEYDGW